MDSGWHLSHRTQIYRWIRIVCALEQGLRHTRFFSRERRDLLLVPFLSLLFPAISLAGSDNERPDFLPIQL